MSQRTPSHRSAIDVTTSAAACRTAGSEASSCSTSGHGGKYGSRPMGDGAVVAVAHEVLRVLVDPRVVGRDVVGDEVEDQADASRRQRLAGARRGRPHRRDARRRGSCGCNRPNPTTSSSVRSGKRLALRRRHRRVGAGDRRAGRAALPHAHQPHGVDTAAGDVVPHVVGDVAEGDRPAGPRGDVVQPHPREDLVHQRVGGQPHGWTPRASRAVATGAIDSPVTRRNGLENGRSRSSTSLGVEVAEELDQRGDEPGPPRLVRRAESGAVVAVEVLVEQDQVAPVRIVLEALVVPP